MSAELLGSVAGVVLSLLFTYVPGLKNKYGALDGTYKRLIMLGLLVLAAAGAFGLACAGWGDSFGITFTCDEAGARELVQVFIVALVANQSAFLISPKPQG